jgi:hypothetical protein
MKIREIINLLESIENKPEPTPEPKKSLYISPTTGAGRGLSRELRRELAYLANSIMKDWREGSYDYAVQAWVNHRWGSEDRNHEKVFVWSLLRDPYTYTNAKGEEGRKDRYSALRAAIKQRDAERRLLGDMTESKDIDAYNASNDDELDHPEDTDKEPLAKPEKPAKHGEKHSSGQGPTSGEKHAGAHSDKHKHHHQSSKDHETRDQKIDREFAAVQGDGDDGGDAVAVENFKKYAHDYGNGLYSIIPYNDIAMVWRGDADNSPNAELINVINDLTNSKDNSEFGWLGNLSGREIVSERVLIMAFYNQKTGHTFKLKASGVKKSMSFGAHADKEQSNTISKIKAMVSNWANSVPDYVPMRSTNPSDNLSGKDKEWKHYENKLLNFVSNNDYAEDVGRKLNQQFTKPENDPFHGIPQEIQDAFHSLAKKEPYKSKLRKLYDIIDFDDDPSNVTAAKRERSEILSDLHVKSGIDKYLNKTPKNTDGVGRDKRFAAVQGDGDDGGDNSEFKKMAGSLGDDLYSIALYDWQRALSNGFVMQNPNSTIDNMLRKVDSQAARSFRHNGLMSDKTISVLIMNGRNGECFTYSSGRDSAGFNDGDNVGDLVSNGLIDDDQKSALTKIENAGKRYHLKVENARWKTGEDPADQRVYDAADELIDTLKLPSMPEQYNPNSIKYSDDAIKKAKEVAAIMKKRREERAAKDNGIGREKR